MSSHVQKTWHWQGPSENFTSLDVILSAPIINLARAFSKSHSDECHQIWTKQNYLQKKPCGLTFAGSLSVGQLKKWDSITLSDTYLQTSGTLSHFLESTQVHLGSTQAHLPRFLREKKQKLLHSWCSRGVLRHWFSEKIFCTSWAKIPKSSFDAIRFTGNTTPSCPLLATTLPAYKPKLAQFWPNFALLAYLARICPHLAQSWAHLDH